MELHPQVRVQNKIDKKYNGQRLLLRFHLWARSHNKSFILSFVAVYICFVLWQGIQLYARRDAVYKGKGLEVRIFVSKNFEFLTEFWYVMIFLIVLMFR